VIRTVLTMVVREGSEEVFEREWIAAAGQIRDLPGSISQTMSRDIAAPRTYTITADWETRADLAAYQDSPHRVALSAVLDTLRESATRSLFDVIAHVTPNAKVGQP
jgi:heme-degrading monooxygenase HmoA